MSFVPDSFSGEIWLYGTDCKDISKSSSSVDGGDGSNLLGFGLMLRLGLGLGLGQWAGEMTTTC